MEMQQCDMQAVLVLGSYLASTGRNYLNGNGFVC